MNCIAVDDEPLALDIIEAYVTKHPELTLVARCNNAAEASEVLKTILELKDDLNKNVIVFDCLKISLRKIKININPDCLNKCEK